jgi:hypothetical protein
VNQRYYTENKIDTSGRDRALQGDEPIENIPKWEITLPKNEPRKERARAQGMSDMSCLGVIPADIYTML